MPYVIDPLTGYEVWEEPKAAAPAKGGGPVKPFNDPNYRVPDTEANRVITTQNAAQPAAPQGSSLPAQRAFNTQTVGADAISADLAGAQLPSQQAFRDATTALSGGSPLAPRATVKTPTVAESLAQYGSGLTTPTGAFSGALTTSQPAVTSNRLATAPGTFDMGGGTKQAPSTTEVAADQATDALGPAPRVDQGLADRRLGEYQEALGMSREVIDRLLNGPSTADRIGSQTLRSQLALARSAAGGPGAVAAAFRNAQNQAPELQAQASQQAAAEDLQRVSAAGNVASNFAQAALGARGQDVDIAKKNTDAGLAVKGMITQLAGTQLELDQRNQEMLGQMARDMAAMDFDWAQLDATQQNAALDRYLQQYGIDANIAAQIKVAQMSGKMSMKDWVNAGVGVLGAAASVGAAAAGKPPA